MTLAAIASTRTQVDVRVHIWVIDQGSPPSVCQRLRQEVGQDLQLIQLGENVGAAEGRNRGISLGQAPYIVGIDNDAEFADANTLARAVRQLEDNSALGVLAFRILDANTQQDDWYSWAYPQRQRGQAHETFLTTRFCAAGFMVRRAALQSTGAHFTPHLIIMWEELDLSYQLLQHGYTIQYEPSVAVHHKVADEMRYTWQHNRFFYFVRNALYLDFKYHRSLVRYGFKALAYLLKGILNRVSGQAWRAIWAALTLLRQHPPAPQDKLNAQAANYIQRYENAVRGTFWQRLYYELLMPIVRNHR